LELTDIVRGGIRGASAPNVTCARGESRVGSDVERQRDVGRSGAVHSACPEDRTCAGGIAAGDTEEGNRRLGVRRETARKPARPKLRTDCRVIRERSLFMGLPWAPVVEIAIDLERCK
jgi:hypothetical protein